jgi:hypothetical protein
MKRIWGHIVSLVVAGLAASAIVPACADNNQTVFIRGFLAPSANRQNNTCVYSDDPSQPQLFASTMDVGITDSYFAVLLFGNQLVARADNANNRAESNRVVMSGAVVKVQEPDGTVIREFTSATVGFADPGANNTPDYGSVGTVVVDAPTREILLAQLPNRSVSKSIVINIKLFGRSLGNEEVETGEFQQPMRVCNGCLVDFSTGNEETAMVQPNCKKPLATTGGGGGTGPCFSGQDEPTPCQSCVATRKVCDPLTP